MDHVDSRDVRAGELALGYGWAPKPILHMVLTTQASRVNTPGELQMDDSYPGVQSPIVKAGRGYESKVPIVTTVSLDHKDNLISARISRQ